MESCQICSSSLDSSRAINCSGSCGKIFHFTCVGITKSHYSTWCAKVGMFWFCESCRLNFEPAVYDREKIIMKALRELLIRTDSMDTRLGNYGDNLKKINRTLYGSQQSSKTGNTSVPKKSFAQSIDELNFDDSIDDTVDRSRSCDDTSFFEVLDEVNGSIALFPEKFVIGGSKRVQIVTNPSSSSTNRNSAQLDDASTISTPPSARRHSNAPANSVPPTEQRSSRNVNEQKGNRPNIRDGFIRPSSIPLKVANNAHAPSDAESFYVTPFAPDQHEDEVKKYVIEISNADPSSVIVTKLVPRGKNIEDLSFVSFKITVCKTVSRAVGDSWYWPDGITVRAFEPNPKNGVAARLPTMS